MNMFLGPRNQAQVMIVSYETFRIHAERFNKPDSVQLVMCDEAHRLKNDATLTNKALCSVPCVKRVMLSGTPMQNNLDEFFSMVNFCNPGLLGTTVEFHKYYEKPILDGREPDATDKQLAAGSRLLVSSLSARLKGGLIEVHTCSMRSDMSDIGGEKREREKISVSS